MFVLLKAHFSSYVHVRPASIGRVENCWSNLNIIIQTWLLVWIIKSLDNWKFEYLWHFSSHYCYCFLHTIVQCSWEVSFAFSWMHFIAYDVTTCTTALSLEGKQWTRILCSLWAEVSFWHGFWHLFFKGILMVCQSHNWFVSIHLERNRCSGGLWFLLHICTPGPGCSGMVSANQR